MNSPAMNDSHCKRLATKAEAERRFAVAPAQSKNFILLNGTAIA